MQSLVEKLEVWYVCAMQVLKRGLSTNATVPKSPPAARVPVVVDGELPVDVVVVVVTRLIGSVSHASCPWKAAETSTALVLVVTVELKVMPKELRPSELSHWTEGSIGTRTTRPTSTLVLVVTRSKATLRLMPVPRMLLSERPKLTGSRRAFD